ncbi:hypothetical protein [Rhizobium sp. P32RR-XVIII]|uniref:hypothetical protein n=1 Tax=Rhizobium sp. P32RR-XVIII TaxID=2726738 RepID=UPI001FEDBD2E|nr:hypothetical protein [Rhizobium sp. P32RR-XVIII]
MSKPVELPRDGGEGFALAELAHVVTTCRDEVKMDDDRQVQGKRDSLATVPGIRRRSADGEEIEEAPHWKRNPSSGESR